MASLPGLRAMASQDREQPQTSKWAFTFHVGQGIWVSFLTQENKCLDFDWQTDSGLTIFFLPVQKAPLKVQLPATAEIYLG